MFFSITFIKMFLMTAKEHHTSDQLTTVEKIKEAARSSFIDNGYSATKIRDIASKAGINLALLNYHFGSKEKLFEILMKENIDRLFAQIHPILNDLGTSLKEKLELLSEHYIGLITSEPNLPAFVLGEIQNHPERFADQIRINSGVMESNYMKQLAEADHSLDPVHHLMTYLGILLFPFFFKPLLKSTGRINEEQFMAIMQQRKSYAPKWMLQILDSKD